MLIHPLLALTLAVPPLALLAGPAPAHAQPADFAREATAMLDAAYPADGPGAAAVVMRGGRVIWSGGRGMADLQAKRPIAADSVFKLGSIAKQFTAAVVLQLVAEGKVSLDDPLSRFFPDWPQPGARATVRQLLSHSSGIQDHSKIVGWMGTAATARPYTTAELLAVIRAKPSTAEPGAKWEYNNGGYAVLGGIIEQVTGKSWHSEVVRRIGKPLGLSTLAYWPDAEGKPGFVRGYSRQGDGYQPAEGAHASVAHAAGGLVASAGDLAKWAQALHGGRVVPAALYREMTSPARLNDGSTQPYGFGLRLRQIRGRPALVHGGAGRGIDTDSAYVPSAELFVAVLANTDAPRTDPASLVRRLAAMALGEPLPVLTQAVVDPATLEPLFGSYTPERGTPWRFFGRDGKLFMGRGDNERQVFAAGGDRFFFGPDDLTWFRFARSAEGAPTLEAHSVEMAAPERSVRTGAPPAALVVPAAVLASYAGTYQTEGPMLTVSVGANGRLLIAQEGREASALRPVSETEFRFEDQPMRVVFLPEGGKVDRMTLHRGARTLNGVRVAK